MKKIWFIFLLSGILSPLIAQDKNDYIWLLGGIPNIQSEKFGGSKIDFNLGSPNISFFEIPFEFLTISMISNSEGVLQFYTNGCEIANANHQIMANGEGLNPGIVHDLQCSYGYPRGQGAISLPWPGQEGRYVILHTQFNQDNSEIHDLRYTTINMDTLGGLGSVITKNQPLIVGEPLADMLTAVRHGNGRDWWIVLPRTSSNTHYLFLLTPQGFQGPYERNFGDEWDYRYFRGHAVFSPDGKKYIRANPTNGLRITDFDRCTGEFSNPITIPLLEDSVEICGVAVSPNSRRLYLATGFKLWQYDFETIDVAASAQLVGEFDGFQSPFNTTFFQPMLAPDGKIYMTCTNGNDVLHVIHNPDAGGLACEFQQHGISIPTYHAFMAPNFPHFRLYDVPGSICDSLGIDAPIVGAEEPRLNKKPGMTLQPNPASDEVLISLPEPMSGQWDLINATGHIVLSGKWQEAELSMTLETSSLPTGIYFYCFRPQQGASVVQKLVISR